MFRVHLQLYQSLVIARCNMFRNFKDKLWQDLYFPYRTVRDSGTCWSVPFWSCKSPRTVSRPALHGACLDYLWITGSFGLCNTMQSLTDQDMFGARHWHISPFYVIFSSSFHFREHILSFRLWWSHWNLLHYLFIMRYSTKFCPGPTWTNPYLIPLDGSLMKGLMKKWLKSCNYQW